MVRFWRRAAADRPTTRASLYWDSGWSCATALAAVGGSFDDVAEVTVYIVDWSGDDMAALGAGVARAAGQLGVDLVRPVTLIPVAALGEPDLLVEVDAIAVLD